MSLATFVAFCFKELLDPSTSYCLGFIALTIIGDNDPIYVPQRAFTDYPRVVIRSVKARHVNHFDFACLAQRRPILEPGNVELLEACLYVEFSCSKLIDQIVFQRLLRLGS